MEDHWIGPMPVELFLRDLLGSPEDPFTLRSPNHLHDSFVSIKSPEDYSSDREYAKAAVSIIKAKTSELTSSLKLALGKEYRDTITINIDTTLGNVTDAFVYNSDVDTPISPTQRDRADLWLEFRNAPSLSGFKDDDSSDEWVVPTEHSIAYRDRLADSAARILNAQYRQHLFSLSLGPDGVRFFKWERTYTIDRRQIPNRVSLLVFYSDGQRPRHRQDSNTCYGRGSVSGKAVLEAPGWMGSINDTWRDANLPKEFETLRTLNNAGVWNVPTFICGGVVPGQITTSNKYINEDWNLGACPSVFCIREHQRILTEEIGQPLDYLKSSKQLTRIVYEAFLAHEDAFTLCKILHRDVSGGNILIVYDDKAPNDNHDGGGRGLLNDWDLAIHTDDLDKAESQGKPMISAHLTGTFVFSHERKGYMAVYAHWTWKRDEDTSTSRRFQIFHICDAVLQPPLLAAQQGWPALPNLMTYIFDYSIDRCDGTWYRGASKLSLAYGWGVLGKDFRFECEPINRCIGGGIASIRRWRDYYESKTYTLEEELKEFTFLFQRAPSRLVFCDHNSFEAYLQKALNMDGWPSNDGPKEQLITGGGTKRPCEDDDRNRQKSTHVAAT